MLQAYRDGKDLYVEIASISFHRPYKMCLEHFPKDCPIKQIDGHWEYAKLKTGEYDTKNNFEDLDFSNINPDDYDYDKLADGETDTFKEGKEYRSQAKKILLGIMYGRGERSIAEQLGCEVEEAAEIKKSVYDAFPRIKAYETESVEKVKEKGYVNTLWGRKRRLPEYNLPQYSFYYVDDDGNQIDQPVPDTIKNNHIDKLNSMYWKKKAEYIEKVKKDEKIIIVDNQGKKAAAGRQIINSQVQGSAADMSKLAMVKLRNDEELIKRDVKPIIPVHDEILIETPLRYAKYVKDRFANDMETAAQPVLTIPIKCDVTSAERWYGDELDVDSELGDLPEV